jgi:hypothetical protein
MGINTTLLIGKILMSEKVYIENESGTYKFDKDGFQATATVNTNTYLVGINPSIPNDIFNIKVNGDNKFYIDTVNNRINAEMWINAIGGTLGNLTVAGTLQGGYINGTSITVNNGLNTVSINPTSGIELYNGSNKIFCFDEYGNIIANNVIFNDGKFKGVLESTTMLSTWTLGNYKNVLEIGQSLFSIDKTDLNGVTQEHAGLYSYGLSLTDFTYSRTADYLNDSIMLHDQYGYLFAVSDVYLSYKGYAIIHSGKNGVTYDSTSGIYLFAPAPHNHYEYALSSDLSNYVLTGTFDQTVSDIAATINSLEARVAALE